MLSAGMPPAPPQKVINGVFLQPSPQLPTAPKVIALVIGSGLAKSLITAANVVIGWGKMEFPSH